MRDITAVRSQWIWRDFSVDFAWLFLPGLLALAVSAFGALQSLPERIAAAIILFAAIVDSGHVYTTLWRTYWNEAERARRPLYFWGPLLIVPAVLAVQRFPELAFNLFFWATIFHNIRQFFGLMRWYERINSAQRKAAHAFFYFIAWFPVFAGVFREAQSGGGLWKFPSPGLFQICLIVYALGILLWVLYEIRLYMRGAREWNRVFIIAFSALLYGYVALYAQSFVETFVPMAISHSIAYFGLTSLALDRTKTLKTLPVLLTVVCTAGFFGLAIELFKRTESLQAAAGPLAGFFYVPILCHYLFDAMIWTGKHPEAKRIYSLN